MGQRPKFRRRTTRWQAIEQSARRTAGGSQKAACGCPTCSPTPSPVVNTWPKSLQAMSLIFHRKRPPGGCPWRPLYRVMVVGWNPAPNLCNSAPYDRCGLLRKGAESRPYCQQSYQFCPAGSPTERIGQDASSIPICGIEPASASTHPTIDQAVTNRSRNARRPWS